MRYKAVILDFDGVVADSVHEGLRRIELVLKNHGIAFDNPARERVIAGMGMQGIDLIEESFGLLRPFAEKIYAAWERHDSAHPIPMTLKAEETFAWLKKRSTTDLFTHLSLSRKS